MRPRSTGELAGVNIVAAFPGGSPDVPSSADRVEGYTKEFEKLGIEIVPSIDTLLEKVDVVLLESVDGRPHLAQVAPVLKAEKPVFIDKPVAGSLADAVAIYELAAQNNVPCFSSSSLRFSPGILGMRDDDRVGKVWAARRAGRAAWRRITPTCSGTEFTAWKRCLRSWGRAARK